MLKYLFITIVSLSTSLTAAQNEPTNNALITELSNVYEENQQPIVWGEFNSPFVRKVLLAMEFKGLPYENKQVLPSKVLAILKQEPPYEFIQASPLGKIPAYQEGSFTIADSSVILAYLEKAYPQAPLYPSSPKEFAHALWLEEYADTIITEVIHKKIFFELVNKPKLNFPTNTTIVQQAIENELPTILEYLEAQLNGPYAGNYFIGNSVTVADIAVATHFINFQVAKQSFDSERYPRLTEYLSRLYQEPAFKKVMAQNPETANFIAP